MYQSLKKYITHDYYRYRNVDISIIGFVKLFFTNRCYRFIVVLRLTEGLSGVPVLSFVLKVLLRLLQNHYGFQISSKTKIGHGFLIGHYGTIVVSHKAVIGNNCNITHGVTIGGAGKGKPKGAPKIGDYVWIGTNAVIVGGINIGNNVLIAPNSFVNQDVPPDSLVIGNPAIIKSRKNASRHYINNVLIK